MDKQSSDLSDNQQLPDPDGSGKFKPLRIWPALILVVGMAVLAIGRLFTDQVQLESMAFLLLAMLGPLVVGLLVMIWWLSFSRATAAERVVGLLGVVLAVTAVIFLSDKTMMGPAIMLITIPMGIAAFAIGAILLRRHLSFKRTIVAVLLAAMGCSFTTLLRSEGMWGHGALDWHWRWQTSNEQNMLAERSSMPKELLANVAATEIENWITNPEWARFRGNDGRSQQHGPKISTNWIKRLPQSIWKKPIGPGWSSYVVAGDLLFTQEQLGEQEAVVCYGADSGLEIWTRPIESRFSDPLGGPGPRATPTLAGGALFAQGANGQLQRLDPKTGDVVWMTDIRQVADRESPTWGFSSSPLVLGSVVVVHAGGKGDKGTLAFDVESGDLKWSAPAGDHSYSSPELCTINGIEYVLMLTNAGIDMLNPKSGEVLLAYDWKCSGYRALQPQLIDGDSILLATQESGTRRIRISQTDAGLAAEEVWTSPRLKPDFNDFVVYENHAYGYDGSIITCIDLTTGDRVWKKGRYGKGQLLLLADSGVLLIVSESGDVVLLKASPEGHEELASFHAIDGRTWNHPVVVGDKLYLRNSEQAACYQLPMASQ